MHVGPSPGVLFPLPKSPSNNVNYTSNLTVEDKVPIIHMINAVQHKNVKNIRADLFDRYVLKPLGLAYAVLFILYSLSGAWLTGGLLAFVCFLVFLISRGMREIMNSPKILQGRAGVQETGHDASLEESDYIEAVIIPKANFQVAGLIGITTALLSWRHGLGWPYIILMGVGLWLLSMAVIPALSLYLMRCRQ